jgi:tetratricopeptide (TPR) repeat protein
MRNSVSCFFGLIILSVIGLSGSPSFGQTMQQLRTCQGKATDEPEAIIRACNAFIETGHAVGGRPIPKNGLGGVLELRANAYQKRGEYDRAIADYTRAIRLSLRNFEYEFYYNRGNSYFAKKDFASAIADYDEAIRQKPKLVVAYINRGNARRNNKDYDRAIADYSEALRIEPRNALATAQLDAVRVAIKLDEKWFVYLQTIQNDGDYANWAGPPVEVFQKPR